AGNTKWARRSLQPPDPAGEYIPMAGSNPSRGDEHHKQDADPEHRHAAADDDADHRQAIKDRLPEKRREQAQTDAQAGREDERPARQDRGGLELLKDLVQHGALEADRVSQVSPETPAEPCPELIPEGLVQPELLAEGIDRLLSRFRTEHHQG